MSQTSSAAAEAANAGSLDDPAAAVSHMDGSTPAHLSADPLLSFGQSRTPAEIFCPPVYICAPLVGVTPGASTFRQDATRPFLLPAPLGSQAIFTAFDLNVKAQGSSTRDTKGLSFLPGIGNRKLHTMMEVEEAMVHFSAHQKHLVREGPCGATWIQRVYKETAGAASAVSPLDSISVKTTLMEYTGYCLNTGDGKGGGSGGIYHLCYGVATLTGVRAWLAGCSKEELRTAASWNEPIASFWRHAEWDAKQVPNLLAPTQITPQLTPSAHIHPGVSTHISSTGILDGGNKGDKSSVNGSSGGQATDLLVHTKINPLQTPSATPSAGTHPGVDTHISSTDILDSGGNKGDEGSVNGPSGGPATEPSGFECQRFGCDEKFQSEQDRDVHQQGCEGLVNGASDVEELEESDVEKEEENKKRPSSPGGAEAEGPKKSRLEAPINSSVDAPPAYPSRVNVRILNERGGESTVAFNQVQHRMYEDLKSEDGRFMQKLMSPEFAAMQEHFIATLLGEARHSGTLQMEANKAATAARQAASNLALNIEENKQRLMASEARETVLSKQAVGLSIEVSSLKRDAGMAESRCEARLLSLREELDGQQESIKSVLVGMVKQLGLEDRVAGRDPKMHTHHTPAPPAPPRATPPTGVVTEENVQGWIDFWKKAPHHAASEEIMRRFLTNVTFMIDKVHKDKCFYCAEEVKCQTTHSGSRFYVHKDTQNNCKTSKCSARSITCRKCESANFTHYHHVHAACPFDFDFCKKIAADGRLKDELAKNSARKVKAETERLQKQEEKERKQREEIEAANRLQALKDEESLKEMLAQVEKMKEKVNKSKASVASGPDPSSASGFCARAPKTPPAQARSPPASTEASRGERVPDEWEFIPARGLSKATLLRWGMPAKPSDWEQWNSMSH